ncbi:hypothetical protein NMG60_11019598 [Bertholletia excelsa]
MANDDDKNYGKRKYREELRRSSDPDVEEDENGSSLDLSLDLLSNFHHQKHSPLPVPDTPPTPSPEQPCSLAPPLWEFLSPRSLKQPRSLTPPLQDCPSPEQHSSPPLGEVLSSQMPQPQAVHLPTSHILFMPSSEKPSLGTVAIGPNRRKVRRRHNPKQAPGEEKSQTVEPPYPWATNRRATLHSFDHLMAKNISTISGQIQCKRCSKSCVMHYDLREKFQEVGSYIAKNKAGMHHRAPEKWLNPVLPTCQFCHQKNCAKPVIAAKKRLVNWLFLLLGQLLGCCTLDQLKYFCKHTDNHRTGAKDRLLYLTYLALCKQLAPNGPFDVDN